MARLAFSKLKKGLQIKLDAFMQVKKTARTKEEYALKFEEIMRSVGASIDKAVLFVRLLEGLDLLHTQSSEGEKIMGFQKYSDMISEKIGRKLTDDEKIKLEILVNASKISFAGLPVIVNKKSGKIIKINKARKDLEQYDSLKTIHKVKKEGNDHSGFGK